MITKATKLERPGEALMLRGVAFSLALMLGLATLAFTLPAEASAQTPGASTTSKGKLYRGGEPQLHVSEPAAAKPDGDKQPIDLLIKLTDESGNPISGAKVMARVTDFETFVDAPLTDMGNGRYGACAFGYFNGSGEGAVRIHVRAEKAGYMPGAGDGSNSVGRLCPVSGTGPSR